MLLVAPAPERRHQIGAFQDAEMLAHRLARYLLTRAQTVQALSVFSKKPVQKLAAFSMSQSLEDRIGVHKRKLYATKWLHVKDYSPSCTYIDVECTMSNMQKRPPLEFD